jgi:RND family efflux transporter MFP subunit
MNKKGLLAALVLCMAAFTFESYSEESQIRYVKTLTVGENDENFASLSYSGVVVARYETSLSFQVGGRVAERKVDNGSAVKKGALLMRLDPVDLNMEVQKAQDAVKAADSDLNLASANLRRYKDLFAKDAVSKSALDTQQNDYDVTNSKKNAAVTNLNEAKQRLGYATLTAETDGVISARKAEVGDVVAAGQEVLRLERGSAGAASEKEIEVDVPEQRVELFRNPPAGARLDVTFWAHSDVSLPAGVREVASQADSATRTYAVRLSVPNLPPEIQSGMTANVSASSLLSADIAVLPISALLQTGDKSQVWLLTYETPGDADDKIGEIRARDVTVGLFMGSNDVQVISGLTRGDTVVTNGVHLLSEGMKARKWSPKS